MITSVNGTKIYYETFGEGDPSLVLVHGLGTNGRLWDGQVVQLSKHYKTVTYDHRGFGRSAEPSESDGSIDLYARDLEALLDTLGLRGVLVGQSMGGSIAVKVAARKPEKVSGLILLGCIARTTPETAKIMEERATTVQEKGVESVLDAAINAAFTRKSLSKRGVIQKYREIVLESSPAGYAMACRAIARISIVDELNSVNCPTLVLVGEDDRIAPPEQSRTICSGINGAKLRIIRDCGHMIPMEQPELLSETILGFLRKTRRGA